MAKYAVIIPAAGKAERFGGGESKIFAKLDGRPLFIRTLERFMTRDDVCQTILAVSPQDADTVRSKFGPNLAFMGVKLAEGGATRCDSVAAALAMVADEADYVAVHDAARPCVKDQWIDEVFAEAVKTGAAILAAPITGTLKRVSEARVIDETVSRSRLYEAQTPQVFRKDLLLAAYQKIAETAEKASDDRASDCEITDDAQLMELAGHAVSVVISDSTNVKITCKGDITLANAILKSRPRKTVPKLGAFEEAQW